MLKKLLQLIQPKTEQNHKQHDHEIHIAAIALLIEVAKADHNLSDNEEETLVKIVESHFGESEVQHKELINLAKDKSQYATSLYEFTSIINEQYSELQKYKLIQFMWKIAISDSKIDAYEEHLIRRVADLIYLPHVKFIEAKLSVLDKQRTTPN